MRDRTLFLCLQAAFMLCCAFGVVAAAVQGPKHANRENSHHFSNYEFWTVFFGYPWFWLATATPSENA